MIRKCLLSKLAATFAIVTMLAIGGVMVQGSLNEATATCVNNVCY